MLAHEETHRRVSIDFALSPDQYRALAIDDGVVVPISVLTKERRRNFSLRDEGAGAIAVLGKEQNGNLAHLALLSAAYDALAQEPSLEVLEMLSADLRQVVMLPSGEALTRWPISSAPRRPVTRGAPRSPTTRSVARCCGR